METGPRELKSSPCPYLWSLPLFLGSCSGRTAIRKKALINGSLLLGFLPGQNNSGYISFIIMRLPLYLNVLTRNPVTGQYGSESSDKH